MAEEENKDSAVLLDCTRVIAKYCNHGETVYHVLRIDFTNIIQGMYITGLPIIETLWMLAVAEARSVQRLYELDMLISLELCDTDNPDKIEQEE